MFTVQEVELLAGILQRAGVNQYEALWCNQMLDRLRAIAVGMELTAKQSAPPRQAPVPLPTPNPTPPPSVPPPPDPESVTPPS